MVRDGLFRNAFSGNAFRNNLLHGAHDFLPAAVVQGQVQIHLPASGRAFNRHAEGRAHRKGQAVQITEDFEGDPFPEHARHLCSEKFKQQGKQRGNFRFGTGPVL